MDDKTKRLIESLRANPNAVQSLFRSQDGQELLRLLTQGDRGAALQQAAQQAAQGNTADMARMVSQLMKSPEGAALVERVNKTLRK